jgi:hypothetical protein
VVIKDEHPPAAIVSASRIEFDYFRSKVLILSFKPNQQMKKLLILALLTPLFILTACGPSEEERKAEQAKNEAMINEKVNEIMQKLEALPQERNDVADSSAVDSTQAAEASGE